MYPLVETIRIRNGVPENLEWHQQRYERTYRTLFGKSPQFLLEKEITVPPAYTDGLVKCRFLYDAEIFDTEFHNYNPSKIQSLKLVEDNAIEYPHKFTERTAINNLLEMKDECDDVLIVKNGLITDSSTANIVFYDGKNWTTPANPLLRGTSRERLLSEGKIAAGNIRLEDLKKFSHFRLINAMQEFDALEMLSISNIK